MIFDEYFYRLTGGRGIDGSEVILELDTKSEAPAAVLGLKKIDDDAKGDASQYPGNYPEPTSAYEKELSKNDFLIESDLIFPAINKAVRNGEKPVVLVIDDDYSTLDLLKIYLMRDYEYHAFSSAREGLLFLHENIVDLIIFDCMIHTTPSEKVVGMIRSFTHCKDVPIIYMGSEAELFTVFQQMPKDVAGTLKRPVARGDLQAVLDKYIKKKDFVTT